MVASTLSTFRDAKQTKLDVYVMKSNPPTGKQANAAKVVYEID